MNKCLFLILFFSNNLIFPYQLSFHLAILFLLLLFRTHLHLSNTFSSSSSHPLNLSAFVFLLPMSFSIFSSFFPSILLLPPHNLTIFFSSLSLPRLLFMTRRGDTAFRPFQVARTITNMQQQIQQHQRQLYQALLMKQQQLPSHSSSSSSSAGLHPPGGPAGGPGSGKSTLDPFTGPRQAPGLADTLHTKEPPSSPSAYSTYPLCESCVGTTSSTVNLTKCSLLVENSN